MTYLDLCQDLVALLGIAGGTGPTTVNDQTGELGNVVRWIKNAELNINNQWEDWRYLWVRYAEQVVQGSSVLPEPSVPIGARVRRWDTDSLKIRSLTPLETTWQDLNFMVRAQFDASEDPDTAQQGKPQNFTVEPDNSVQLDRPADTLYAVKGSFYRSPAPLAEDGDVSPIPEEYHRIIVVRAAIMYGDREDAPEVISGAETEYLDILDKLEGSQLEAFRYRRASRQESRTGTSIEPRWG